MNARHHVRAATGSCIQHRAVLLTVCFLLCILPCALQAVETQDIEKATGRTYYGELRRQFLDPLGLTLTSASDHRRLPRLVPGVMIPNSLAGSGSGSTTMTESGVLVYNPNTEWTGGGLVTNAGDLALWAKALYESRAMEGDYLSDLLAGVAGESAADYPSYGMGQGIQNTEHGLAFGHSGWIPGYVSFMAYFSDYRVAVAVQFNTTLGADSDTGPIALAKSRLPAVVLESVMDISSAEAARAGTQTDELALAEFQAFRDSVASGSRASLAIKDPNGIDVVEAVQINGLEQWISIRGYNRDDPVLLYLHGGPGAAMMPFAHRLPVAWEENFVVVHWDQRGTGKTRCANPDYDPAEATFDDFYSDTLVLIDHLRKRLGKDKIIVLGHSWGSILGLHLARKNPEFLHAYVGTGQVVNVWEAEGEGYQFLLKEAKRRGDEEGLAALESIAPYPDIENHRDKIGVQRHFMQKYGASLRGMDFFEEFQKAFFDSPLYSVCDWMGFVNTNFSPDYPHRPLTMELMEPDSPNGNLDQYGYEFEVPMFFFLGALDYHTPTNLAKAYLEKIKAPYKKLVLFEDSAHAATNREKDKFVKALVDYVRPVAR